MTGFYVKNDDSVLPFNHVRCFATTTTTDLPLSGNLTSSRYLGLELISTTLVLSIKCFEQFSSFLPPTSVVAQFCSALRLCLNISQQKQKPRSLRLLLHKKDKFPLDPWERYRVTNHIWMQFASKPTLQQL